MNPPELIGRDMILDDFSEALANGVGAPDRLMRISGVRGVGKTVLLNALGDIARANGFVVVDVASNAGFCDRILHALTGRGEISSLTISPSILGMSLGSAEVARPATQLGEAMLDASKRSGLLVTLDEIQDAPIDELRELGNEIQLLIRQEANVAFAFAGMRIAVSCPDRHGCLLAAGLTAMIAVQAFINIGVVVGVLPTTGLPLPFFSAGGTSISLLMAATGIILSVSRTARK